MNNKNDIASGGCAVGFGLFLIFLTLKLVGVIAWSWWWVTAPLWIPVSAALVLLTLCAACVFALRK